MAIVGIITALLLLAALYGTIVVLFGIVKACIEKTNFGPPIFIILAIAIWADIMLIIFLNSLF